MYKEIFSELDSEIWNVLNNFPIKQPKQTLFFS